MKNTALFLLLSFTSLISISQSLNDSLLIYYPFSGNAIDNSGNGFDGDAQATLTNDNHGIPNSAYSFNGENEFIDLPNDIRLKPELPISFSYLVLFESLEADDAVIFTTDFSESTHSGVWMNISSTGKISISIGDAQGNFSVGNRRTKNGSIINPIDIWHHIIGIVRGPEDMDIYIDCNYDIGSYDGYGDGLGYTSSSGSLGRKDANFAIPPYYFKGKIDEFRYWNRALTSDDIDSLCRMTVNIDNINSTPKIANVYPNPFSYNININSKIESEVFNIFIYDSYGKLIRKICKEKSMDLYDLRSGFYYIKAFKKDDEILFVEKLIKQ